jgi:hypothetical protein
MTGLIATFGQVAAEVASSAAQGALGTTDPNPLRDWVASGMALYYFQKWLKQRPQYAKFVELFPGTDKWAHRFVPFAGAVLATCGIHYTWNGTLFGGGVIIVTLPPLQQIAAGLGHFGFDVGGIYGIAQTCYECSRLPQSDFQAQAQAQADAARRATV